MAGRNQFSGNAHLANKFTFFLLYERLPTACKLGRFYLLEGRYTGTDHFSGSKIACVRRPVMGAAPCPAVHADRAAYLPDTMPDGHGNLIPSDAAPPLKLAGGEKSGLLVALGNR